MREIFQGWRRKMGCVTLLMACVLMGVWIRSRFIVETFRYCPDGPARYSITLVPKGVRWIRQQGSGSYLSPRFFGFDWNSAEYSEGDDDPVYGWQSKWNWQSCGFQFGSFQLSSQPVPLHNIEDGSEGPPIWIVYGETQIGVIPYWSLVLPPTLLSAYLILWKPRKRTGPDHARALSRLEAEGWMPDVDDGARAHGHVDTQ